MLGVAPATHDADTAARFDGGNDKVAVPDPANGSLDFGVEDFTVEVWTKPLASDERTIVSKRLRHRRRAVLGAHGHGRPRPQRQDPGDLLRRDEHAHRVLDDRSARRGVAPRRRVVRPRRWDHALGRRGDELHTAGDDTRRQQHGPGRDRKGGHAPVLQGVRLDEVALYAGLLPVARAQAHRDAA